MNKKEGHAKINKIHVDQSFVTCLKYVLVLHTQKDNFLEAVGVFATRNFRRGFHIQLLTFFDFLLLNFIMHA
jgi:hypothetical protein